ncbi:MAG: T9SS type A sorting domain-containing protein [Saprospiraceae bacterium]|nr:T9SS type A sorting domain-containing protein [Saprospiraceae bacterium]
MKKLKYSLFVLISILLNNYIYCQVQVGNNFEGSLNTYWHVGGQGADIFNPVLFSQNPISLSEDGNRVAIHSYSVPLETGVTSIYEWDGSTWTQMGEEIIGDNPSKLSNDGTRIIVKTDGMIKVMNWDGNNWDQLGTAIDITTVGAIALSPSGDWFAFREYNSIRDYLHMYSWNGADWEPLGEPLEGPINHDFGILISLASDQMVMSIASYPIKGVSQVAIPRYVSTFQWDGVEWVQRGTEIFPDSTDDKLSFAINISLSNNSNTIAINSSESFVGGLVYVYDWNGTEWLLRGNKILSAGSNNGISIGMSNNGDQIYLGHPYYDIDYNEGKAEMHQWTGSEWVLKGNIIEGTVENDLVGHAVAISGDGLRVAVSSVNADLSNQKYLGRVQVFENFLTSTRAQEIKQIKISPNPFNDQFTIELGASNYQEIEISIFNILGEQVNYQKITMRDSIEIQTSNLLVGTYFVYVKKDNKIYNAKLLKS